MTAAYVRNGADDRCKDEDVMATTIQMSFCVRYMVAYAINKYSNSCSCVSSIILRFVLLLVIGIVV